ncbi:MAG: efflux transporter periplasmic adaptor subunit, partial [Planctomycetota bacterium]|nr:efflux transporter periplasmic adaptor subunit [Planctomycetota bacterium]
FVRAGQKLVRLIDPSQLRVEVPVDRAVTNVGGNTEISIEGTPLQAKVDAIIGLEGRFHAVRDLIPSPAQGVLLIDNSAGKLRPGQTVISPLLPQEPVTSVPSAAVSNLPDGRRKVQVLRDNVVRNLTVRILGRAGGEQVFVSGRFGATDEVVVSTTRELVDGTPLRALVAGAAKTAKGSSDKKKKPATTTSGF